MIIIAQSLLSSQITIPYVSSEILNFMDSVQVM